ncbi:MAG: SDR family oxidoreductase [Acidimicrobiales bacterium]
MDLGLGGRGALVVGANGGIGRAVCQAFIREGIERLTLAVRSRAKGELLAEDLRRRGQVSLLVVEFDLEDPAAPARSVAESTAANGPVDVVVLCAGSYPNGGLWDVDDDDWERGITTKLLAGARLMRAAIPAMGERGWGRVVIVAGLHGRTPSGNAVIGGVVNVGLANLASAVTKEVASKGVTVNTIDPAHVRTPRWEKRIAAMREAEGISDEEAVARIRNSAPNKRMTPPEDVADLIAFLASDRGSSITGSSIPIDGGYYPGLF